MEYRLLPWILEQEQGQFQQVNRVWRPAHLIPEPYRRQLLGDIKLRYARLFSAFNEFKTLDRGDVYIKLIHRMRLTMKTADYAWRYSDLAFFQAISGFYSDYGTILRFLATDKARGKLSPNEEKEQ